MIVGDGKTTTHVKSFCWSAGKTAGPSTMPAMNWENDAVGSPLFVCGMDSFYVMILCCFAWQASVEEYFKLEV